MKGDKVIKAVEVAMGQFYKLSEGLIKSYGFEYSSKRKPSVFLGNSSCEGRVHIEVFIDILGEPTEVRMSVWNKGSLQVGWGSNNLLSTNTDVYNDRQIALLGLVHHIFRDEAKWREVISATDFSVVSKAEAEERAEALAEQEREKQEQLNAFKESGIVVGTVVRSRFGDITVTRISGNRVQVGKSVYSKEAVGECLLSGKWQVKR